MPEKISADDLTHAVEDLGMCEYFPRDPGAAAGVMRLLAQMVPHKQALDWLVDEMVNRIGKWHGPAELRGLLCNRYRPADGIERDCSIPGYTPGDGETRSLEAHAQLKAGGYLEPASDALVKRLGAVKRLT